MKIKLSSVKDALFISEYYLENAEHLEPWEPIREPGYHDISSWKSRLEMRELEQSQGQAAYFLAYADDSSKIVAVCNLTSIVRGPFQACYMGYSVSRQHQGQGIMKMLCQHALDYAFNSLNLNRVMANYIPHNVRSEYLLKSLGFEKEGLAKKYLCINGQWEDHILTAIINPKNR
ncbi:MAG: GNAT family N-acetyltransferase [Proteobacteria bacterium]|nr:GNAT family N-acetyltransferase [Pseudomonadota bacterium]